MNPRMEADFDLLDSSLQPGLNVIEADAGTGKTWTLAHLVPRLLISGQVERLDQLLLVSFTEDATRELAGRVRATLADLLDSLLTLHPRPDQCPDLTDLLERARQAAEDQKAMGRAMLLSALLRLEEKERLRRLRGLLAARLDADRLVVGTIHSLCRRVLDDEGFLCGMPSGFEVTPQTHDLRAQALRDVWRQDLAPDPLLAALCQGWTAKNASWSLEKDAEAWDRLRSADSEALMPEPLTLDQAKAACSQALSALRALEDGLSDLEKLLRAPGLGLNTAGKRMDIPWLAKLWEGLDPNAPSVVALQGAQSLTSWDGWVRKDKGRTNQATRAELALHPLIQAADALGSACEDLAWAWRGHALKAARRRLDQRLREANQVSFNGLVEGLAAALQGPQGDELAQRLRKRWKLALVDECQDTDQRQLAIFEAVFNRPGELDCALVLIGDPKQSIYSFRGADLDAYERVRDRPGVQILRLSTARRPAADLVRALNRLFDRARPHPLASPALALPEAIPARGEDELPLPQDAGKRLVAVLAPPECAQLWSNADKWRAGSAEAAARAVATLLGRPVADQGHVRPGDCAFLVRDRRQAQALRQALDALHIPSVLRDNGDVFDGGLAAELRTLLDAVLKPGQNGRHRDALATRLLGFDATQLRSLEGPPEDAWLERFRAWRRTWEQEGVAALLERLDRDAGLRLNLAGLPDGERLLTDLVHLEELLAKEEAAQNLSPERLLRWFDACTDETGGGEPPAEARLRRLETDSAAVQILTVHGAKGLEFDYCFLPFLWCTQAPDASEPRVIRLDNGTSALAEPSRLDANTRMRLNEEACRRSLEEELRLAYVALTRAKRRVWLLAGWLGYGPGRS
ncbi:MAG: UvrD-helicase domain-containing protein, partial [bacterium]